MIDLRSDTTTVPGASMLRAMTQARVGDDGFGEDPATNELEEYCAALFCKEAALFTPSGTMSNQVALRVHTRPGDEVVVEEASHFNTYESAPSADLAGVSLNTVRAADGILTPELVEAAVDAKCRDPRYAQPRMLALENTINYHAGRVVPLAALREVAKFAQDSDLRTHLDGARLFNAIVASRTRAADYGEVADTVSVCFAKGLGAPFGSVLVGPGQLIDEARYYRKSYGGALHQCGYLAAAALYALRHNVDRLAEDHAAARLLADGLRAREVPGLDIAEVQSNMVIVNLARLGIPAHELVERVRQSGVLLMGISRFRVRMVTHLGFDAADAPRVVATVAGALRAAIVQHHIRP